MAQIRNGRGDLDRPWIRYAVMLASIIVGGYGVAYLVAGPEMAPIIVRASREQVPATFLTHVGCGGLALLVGSFQFSTDLRRTRPRLHRLTGYVYCTACFLSAMAGAVLAIRTTAGPWAGAGFLLLACTWFASTAIAVSAAVQRQFKVHQAWMTISFALALSGVTLRLYLPLIFLLGLDFISGYRVIAWAAWVPNLLVALATNARRRVAP